MNNCPFCNLVKSDDALLEVGEYSVAFLDINPIRPGHVLIVPKNHEPDFFNLPDYILLDIMQLARRIAKAQEAVFQPIKVGMLVAGFDVSHAHLHIIPMHEYHDITSKQVLEASVSRASQAQLQKIKQLLQDALNYAN
ncbi:histidine triad domain protein [Calothrix parasitica NIES-267]|uniref:Histidine triad domain protein n=1 Tax=Calothrix parasitica NIES-267 TaxID=1973488 RepID=A0A1Z4LHC2_9CYAN|nr:histidine triad domain protein [Calothrix parasitica NIES-267]